MVQLKEMATIGGSDNGNSLITTVDHTYFCLTGFNMLKSKVFSGEIVLNFTLNSLMSTASTFMTWKSTSIFSSRKKFMKEWEKIPR